MDILKEVADLENTITDRCIHPAAKYDRVLRQCQQIANIAGALWPPPPEPEPEPEPLSESAIAFHLRMLRRIIGDLNREGDQQNHTGFFIEIANLLMEDGLDTEPIWEEAFRAELPDDELAAFFSRLNIVIGGEGFFDIDDIWQARTLPSNVRKWMLRQAGAVIRGRATWI